MGGKILRWVGIVATAVVLVIVVAVAAVYFMSSRRLSRTWAITPETVAIPTDSASIEYGRHLATARVGCTDCHTPDLGGQVMIDNGAFGRFVPANLTSGKGGVGGRYTTGDWVRLLRHGVRPNGTAVVLMPVQIIAGLNDHDLGALIAYVRSVPPVDRELPSSKPGPIARMLVVTNQAPLIPAEVLSQGARPAPVEPAVSAAYGEYLVQTSGCRECHGQHLSGGKVGGDPSSPPAANLTPTGIGSWSEADFFQALRQGKRPDGSTISDYMPWKSFGKMTDDELRAVWMYLQTVPARPTGQG